MTTPPDPLALDAAAIERLLDLSAPLFPELEAARANPAALLQRPQAAALLARSDPFLADAGIPATRYSDYRRFLRDGDRASYETPYFDKRAALSAAALRLFLSPHPPAPSPAGGGGAPQRGGEGEARLVNAEAPLAGEPEGRSPSETNTPLAGEPEGRSPSETNNTQLVNLVHDLIWSICEESNWVAPAHETRRIDLFAAETAFLLGETLALLGPALDAEVRSRVRQEVERRVFEPYLRFHAAEGWHQGRNNWNGVCNSSVAASFLLLEPEPGRAARALAIAFAGLRTFLRVAFEEDGSSNEGVSYWHYGLINVVALAEMLRARSRGAIDLLASERVRRIAAYPAKMQLAGPRFASFSDCDELLGFHPGILTRLAERTGERSLLNLVGDLDEPGKRPPWRLPMNLRTLLWWDGQRPARQPLDDAVLPSSGVARLVGSTPAGAPLVLAAKAGHNDENHNQNDVGSFIVHVGGENLLVDPGRGLYSRFYFGPQRYENIFASSYGHSVPRVGGQLQQPGAQFRGELLGVARDSGTRRLTIEMAGAYAVPALVGLRRELVLGDDGAIRLDDTFTYNGDAPEVEEALVTWGEVAVDGAAATVRGEQHALRLTVEAPAGAVFELEALEDASRANKKHGVLKRLTVALPPGAERFSVRMEAL